MQAKSLKIYHSVTKDSNSVAFCIVPTTTSAPASHRTSSGSGPVLTAKVKQRAATAARATAAEGAATAGTAAAEGTAGTARVAAAERARLAGAAAAGALR